MAFTFKQKRKFTDPYKDKKRRKRFSAGYARTAAVARSTILKTFTSSRGILHMKRKGPLAYIGCQNQTGVFFPRVAGYGADPNAVNPNMGSCSKFNFGTAVLNPSGLYDLPMSIVFNPTNIQNFTECAAIFDKVRLNHVLVKFIFPYQQASRSDPAVIPGPAPLPQLDWVIDRDDFDPPATPWGFMERMGIQTAIPQGNGIISVGLVPNTANVVDSTTITPTLLTDSRKYKQWYNTANTGSATDSILRNLPFYGIKLILRNIPLPPNNLDILPDFVKIDVEYSLSFKDII